jgi:hypothetical protein
MRSRAERRATGRPWTANQGADAAKAPAAPKRAAGGAEDLVWKEF